MNLTRINTTMSSFEIAELTNKRHDNVMVDIRKMLEELKLAAPEFSGTQNYGNNNTREIFNLPKRECDILISGYEIKYRAAIIDRWQELENKQNTIPNYSDKRAMSEMYLAMAEQEEAQQQLILATEAVNRRAAKIESIVDREVFSIKDTIANLETKSRRGVPIGFSNSKLGWKVDGRLSQDAHIEAMTALGVPNVSYVHTTAEGYEVYATAYRTNDIKPAIDAVIASAVQISPKYYISPYIKSKFKINK